jgi:hypothetical protein
MPFTLSHPAAVIPVRWAMGRRASLSALVIGSMSPDFAHFLPVVTGVFTHSLPGILLFDLPAAIAVYFLFHWLIKRPATTLLPERLAACLSAQVFDSPLIPAIPFLTVVLSLVLGAFTHVAWDAFTHENTVIVQNHSALDGVAFDVRGQPIQIFKLLQYLSSVFGLAIIFWCTWRWVDRQPAIISLTESPSLPLRNRVLILGAAIAAAPVGSLIGVSVDWMAPYGLTPWRIPWERTAFLMIIGAMDATALVLLAYCIVWNVQARQRGEILRTANPDRSGAG